MMIMLSLNKLCADADNKHRSHNDAVKLCDIYVTAQDCGNSIANALELAQSCTVWEAAERRTVQSRWYTDLFSKAP